MFTGIIEETGRVRSLRPMGKGRRIDLACSVVLENTAIGDSIAVNGVCLTVVEIASDSFAAEAVEETMSKTTLGQLKTGDAVNLERALRADGKLGGHFVQGHVDVTSHVVGIQRREDSWMVEIAMPEAASRNIIPMGSVAIDGVSLTVAEKGSGSFRVSVIPHTFGATLFQQYRSGTRVNLELDMIGKYVLNYLQSMQGEGKGVTESFLKGLGY